MENLESKIEGINRQLLNLKNNTIKNLQIGLIKTLVSTSGIILSVFATFALSARPSEDKLLFHSLMCFFLLCILSGLIVLYILLAQHRIMADDLAKEGIRMNVYNDPKMRPVFSPYNTRLLFFEKLCFVSFLISMSLLVMYVW